MSGVIFIAAVVSAIANDWTLAFFLFVTSCFVAAAEKHTKRRKR